MNPEEEDPPCRTTPKLMWVSLGFLETTQPTPILFLITITISGGGVSYNQIRKKETFKIIKETVSSGNPLPVFNKNSSLKGLWQRLLRKKQISSRGQGLRQERKKERMKKISRVLFLKSQDDKFQLLTAHHSWVTVSRPPLTSGLRCGVVVHSCQEAHPNL